MIKQLYKPRNEPMRIAAFMSGTGSNLRKIIELQQQLQREGKSLFKVVMIFTDTANETTCNAKRIAEEYKIAYYCNDMKEYYRNRGHNDRKDMKIREEYDAETEKLLRMHKVDVVALCGYMSIVTRPVIGNFLTVNVHPADLRVKEGSGKRKYAGAECVKRAILNGEKEIRATTHVVSEGVDEGQILLVSKPVKLEVSSSYGSKPFFEKGLSKNEELERISHVYQEKLKEEGDWKIYPETLKLLAKGRFAADSTGAIYLDGKPIPNGHAVG